MPPASPGVSPRSVVRSDPGFSQIPASSPRPGTCKILCAPFKGRVSIAHSPLGLPKVSPTGLQSQRFWELIFPAQDPQAGEPNVGLRPLVPWRGPLVVVIMLPLVGHAPVGMGLDYTVISPLLPVLLWFLHHIFSCRRSFLVGSGFFHPQLLCKYL